MKINELNRFKEFFCVLFGHDFGSNFYEREGGPDGFVLEHHSECVNCGIAVNDNSGRLQRYKEKYG